MKYQFREVKFKKATKGMLNKVIARSSPFYQNGEWISPECAVVAGIISQWGEDLILKAKRAHAGCGGFLMRHVAYQEISAVSAWCEMINIDSEFPKKLVRDLEVCGVE